MTVLLLAGACSNDDPYGRPGDAGTGREDAGAELDARAPDGAADVPLAAIVEAGNATVTQEPRPAYGALVVANAGERRYVVESRRDVETGPFGLPWRSRFRVAAYDRAVEVWSFEAEPDDVIGDVVVHPSGDITLSLQRQVPERMAYQLVRLSSTGSVISD